MTLDRGGAHQPMVKPADHLPEEPTAAIPHRPPFLFVDEVVEVSGERIRTRTFIDPGMEVFRGHYPGRPIMPGVLLCEACFQAGAILISCRLGGYDAERGVPVVTRITDARFKRMVKPGATIEVEATLDEELEGAYFLTGRITAGGKAVLRVQFACMLAEGDEAS